MKKSFLLRGLALAAGLMLVARGARAEVMVGDPAPPIQSGQFVQGEPVRAFDTNHVYVVEFWATWCGPCVQSIPHLNALWEKYQDKGVVVIGQDVWDNDSAVAAFVKKMGTNMTYRVALDDKSQIADGFMDDRWWKRGTNYHGIPTAFIINRDGKVAWIGHPMSLKEQVLDGILSGQYDLAKAAEEYRKDQAENTKFQDLEKALRDAVKQKQWDQAQTTLASIQEAFPHFKNGFVTTRIQILIGQKKFDAAYQLAETQSKTNAADDYWQNELAWTIATSDGPDDRCLALARTMAESAVHLTQGTNGESLDTLARVQFMQGQHDAAIATEGKAMSFVDSKWRKDSMEKTLSSYKEGKLPDAN